MDGDGDNGDGYDKLLKPLQNQSQRLTFQTRLPCGTAIKWATIFNGETLYVALPDVVFPEGSRDAFISLLETAEEKLKSQTVVVSPFFLFIFYSNFLKNPPFKIFYNFVKV